MFAEQKDLFRKLWSIVRNTMGFSGSFAHTAVTQSGSSKLEGKIPGFC